MERTFNIGDIFQVREIIVECTGVIHDDEFVFGIPCNTDGEIKEMKFPFSEITERWEKKSQPKEIIMPEYFPPLKELFSGLDLTPKD